MSRIVEESKNVTRLLVEAVQKRYPGWKDCSDPNFQKDEIEKKRKASNLAQELLGKESFQALLVAQDFDTLYGHVIKLVHSTNLLYLAVPKSGDCSVLHADGFSRETFFPAFFELLHGDGTIDQRFDAYVAFLQENALPNKWPFPTYFLYLVNPALNLFIKPTVIKRFLRLLKSDNSWSPKPTGKTYRGYCEAATQLLRELKRVGASDLIDVQSLLWTAQMMSGKTDGIDSLFEELYAQFEQTFVHTEKGAQHSSLLAESRKQGVENFAALRKRFESGQILGDEVCVKLFPHSEAEFSRKSGAWVSIAPLGPADLRVKYAKKGWITEEDWPTTAQIIMEFLIRCVETPNDMEDACLEFDATISVKGIQSGTLSPILNSLIPDRFPIVNSKSLRMIKMLTAIEISPSIRDYPSAVATLVHLSGQKQPILARSVMPGLSTMDMLDMFAHWLVSERKFEIDQVPGTTEQEDEEVMEEYAGRRYWKIAPGENARKWTEWRDTGVIGIGWSDIGDVSNADHAEFDRMCEAAIARNPKWNRVGMEQVWKFANEIQIGDVVVANDGISAILGVGIVRGEYMFVAESEYVHQRAVDWTISNRREVNEQGWRRTLVELKPLKFAELVPDFDQLVEDSANVAPPGEKLPNFTLDQCATETHLPLPLLQSWVSAIDRKGQAVLYGPPGTGKTFVAERLARHIVGGGDGFIELVQFHPSYGYEDFIQGIRPRVVGSGSLSFEIVPGRFLEFCRKATQCEAPCVLIVDEINRANLSRVFGELMYLLEYRDKSVPLASGGTFAIPRNVRVIGTMNTADRSIALVDHALRRRFAFLRLDPNLDVLVAYHRATLGVEIDALAKILSKINERINDPHYSVGISFFLVENLSESLPQIWTMEIEPYIEEYFFNRPDVVEEFRWDKLAPGILG